MSDNKGKKELPKIEVNEIIDKIGGSIEANRKIISRLTYLLIATTIMNIFFTIPQGMAKNTKFITWEPYFSSNNFKWFYFIFSLSLLAICSNVILKLSRVNESLTNKLIGFKSIETILPYFNVTEKEISFEHRAVLKKFSDSINTLIEK